MYFMKFLWDGHPARLLILFICKAAYVKILLCRISTVVFLPCGVLVQELRIKTQETGFLAFLGAVIKYYAKNPVSHTHV
jgi:hypothetical protein